MNFHFVFGVSENSCRFGKHIFNKFIVVEEANKFVETPLMKQYYAIKAKYPDALLYSGW